MGRTRKVATTQEISEQISKVRYQGSHPYLKQTTGIFRWDAEQNSWLYQPAGKLPQGLTGEWFRVNPQSVENE